MALLCTPLQIMFYVVKAKHSFPFFLVDQIIPIFISGNIITWYSSSLASYIHVNIAALFLTILIIFFCLTNQDTFPKA